MKRLATVLLGLLATLCIAQDALKVGVDYSGRLIVKPKAGQATALLFEFGDALDARLSAMGLYLVPVPKGVDPIEYCEKLMGTGAFEYVHPDYLCHPAALPNDPMLLSQWHLFQISAPRAWDATAGNSGVVVAITDTGVDLTHPDLQNRVSGYNAASHVDEASGGLVNDVHSTGHGTRVTGLACATGNNGTGIAGVAYNCPFMPIRVSNATNGTAVMADILEGIQWAVDHGARVVNTSYDNEQVAAVETAGEYAWNHGAFSVWAAGNQGVDTKNLNGGIEWDHKRVVIVGATDQTDAKASFSNYGKAIDVFAPGLQVLTTSKGGGYGNVSGTSFASPIVAGSLALILAQNPGIDLQTAQMRLFRCCRDLGVEVQPDDPAYKPGNDMYWGWGRPNVGSSLLGWPQNLLYRITELPPLPGYIGSTARAVNDLGEVVGWSGVGNDVRATKWLETAIPTGIGALPSGAVGDIAVAINNRGDVALSAFFPNAWPYRYSGGATTRMPNNLGSDGEPFDLNEAGSIIGRINASLTRSFVWPLNGTPYDPGFAPGWGAGSGTAMNDNGLLTQTVGPGGGNYFAYQYDGSVWTDLPHYAYLNFTWCFRLSNSNLGAGYSQQNDGSIMPILWDLDDHTFDRFYPNINGRCQDVNEFEEAIGYDSRNNLVVIYDGFRTGYLRDLLASSPPSGIAYLEVGFAVSNRHVIVGRAVKNNGQFVAFRADPVEGIQVTVDLGQLGSNPSYIGALPPAFVVDFKDEQGNKYVGSRRTYTYDSLTGHAQVVVPPEVTGPFRAYFRLTNAADNPEFGAGNWQGPGYLGMVYPPMNLPALPIDASYIPPISLFLGDSDSDNEITIADYSIVSRAFGTFIGDPDWDARADIDGDEEISQGDLDKIIENFGLVGD